VPEPYKSFVGKLIDNANPDHFEPCLGILLAALGLGIRVDVECQIIPIDQAASCNEPMAI